MIIAIYKMPTNPLASFILTVSSGLLDSIDGDFARYFHQTSKVGMLFDISIDRFTNLAQMFFLTRIFQKYCTAFLLVGFMEFARDLVYWIYAYYSILLTIFNHLVSTKTNIDREAVYEYLFFNKKPTSNLIIRPHGAFIHEIIYPLIWYSSDVFYWIILIVGFNIKNTRSQSTVLSSRSSATDSPLLLNDVNNSDNNILINDSYSQLQLIEDMNFVNDNQVLMKKKSSLRKKIVASIRQFTDLFDYIGNCLDEYLDSKLRFNSFKFQKMFKFIGLYFLISAFLKFYLSTYEFSLLTYNLIVIDMKSIDTSKAISLKDFFKM